MLETASKPMAETEESLRTSREQFKQFASHLQTQREEEKVNLSRELHDSLGQSLTGVKIYAHRILKGLNVGMNDAQVWDLRQQMNEIIRIIDASLKGVKKIARELHPRILDEFGLIAAIEWFVQEHCSRIGIQYFLKKEIHKIELNKNLSLEVYRIFQETISHIICQSNTTMLTVTIKSNDQYYSIEMLDNEIRKQERDFFACHSIRIMGVYERARAFGGSIQFSQEAESGIKAVLSIPIPEMK
jgi:signal transduction histidine kinase